MSRLQFWRSDISVKIFSTLKTSLLFIILKPIIDNVLPTLLPIVIIMSTNLTNLYSFGKQQTAINQLL